MHKVSLKRAYILCLNLVLGSFCVTQAASDNPNNYQWPLSNQATSVFMCPLCENPSNSEFHKDFCTINNQPIMPLSTYPLPISYEDADTVTCPLCEHPFNSIHHDISCNLTQPVISTNTSTLLPDLPSSTTTAAPWCNTCNRSTESGYHELICTRFQPTMPPQNQQPINPLLQAAAEARIHEQIQQLKAAEKTLQGFRPPSQQLPQEEQSQVASTESISAQSAIQKKSTICTFCGRECRSDSNRILHEYTHTGNKPFKCDVKKADGTICGKEYPTENNLTQHRRTHINEKTCIRSSQSAHPYKRVFRCNLLNDDGTICKETRNNSTSLYRHRETHPHRKRYRCSCGATFTQLKKFNTHKITKQCDDEESDYEDQ